MGDVDCQAIEERLPWFLHGGLTADERSEIVAHLASCAACRQALDATREAAAIFAAHPPAAALVDYALGLPLDFGSRELLERHLGQCDACREELELVVSERSGVTPEAESAAVALRSRVAAPRPGPGWFATLALAASLAVASGLAVWVAMRGEPVSRVALVELLPEDVRSRGVGGEEVRVDPRSATTLLLVTDRAEAFEEARARLSGPDGRALWEGRGLAPTAGGAYALLLPRGTLPAGEVGLELEGRLGGEWVPIARYRFTVAP